MGLEGWAVEEVVFDSPGNKVAAAEVISSLAFLDFRRLRVLLGRLHGSAVLTSLSDHQRVSVSLNSNSRRKVELHRFVHYDVPE